MKKKRVEKKKRKQVRERDWESAHETSFTHDLVKHRRARVKLSASAGESNPLPKGFVPNGTVVSHTKKWAQVDLDGVERLCLVDERMKEADATLLAPGDRVLVEFEGEDAIVRGVAPRRTRLSRPSNEESRLDEQVVAANVDLLVVVASAAHPPFREGLVDRYLIAADRADVATLLCVNKMDLAATEPPALETYRELGVPVVLTSCESGMGIDALRAALAGQTAVLSGHSGVGKSSLLNALAPGLAIGTGGLGKDQRGTHTTSAGRLYTLPGGARVIDTPGIRALGLWGVGPAEVAYYFPEIGEHAAGCRFRDCTHTHEPRCAVLAAVEAGAIGAPRFASYLRIRASLESEQGMTPGRVSVQHSGRDLPR